MDPETQTLVSNIESLLAQLKQLAGGAADGAAAPTVTAAQDTTPPAAPATTVAAAAPVDEAAQAAKSAEGATASDSAEQRLDDLPEEALDNVDEVAKTALRALVKKGKIVITTPDRIAKSQKAFDTRISMIAKSVGMLANVVKGVMADQEETMEAVKGVLEGLGVSDSIQKAFAAQQQNGGAAATQVQKSQPILNPDQHALLALLQKGMTVAKAAEGSQAQGQIGVQDKAGIRKGLGEVMTQLFPRQQA